MEGVLTITELAEKLKVSTQTIRALVKKGLPYVWVNKRKRFEWNRVIEWLQTEAQA